MYMMDFDHDSLFCSLDLVAHEYINYRKKSHGIDVTAAGLIDNRTIVAKMRVAIDTGDYETGIELWDRYASALSAPTKHEGLFAKMEILLHLIFVTFSFRISTLHAMKSPKLAAKMAAKNMMFFKKFLAGRGNVLMNSSIDLSKYRNLTKGWFRFYIFVPKFLHIVHYSYPYHFNHSCFPTDASSF